MLATCRDSRDRVLRVFKELDKTWIPFNPDTDTIQVEMQGRIPTRISRRSTWGTEWPVTKVTDLTPDMRYLRRHNLWPHPFPTSFQGLMCENEREVLELETLATSEEHGAMIFQIREVNWPTRSQAKQKLLPGMRLAFIPKLPPLMRRVEFVIAPSCGMFGPLHDGAWGSINNLLREAFPGRQRTTIVTEEHMVQWLYGRKRPVEVGWQPTNPGTYGQPSYMLSYMLRSNIRRRWPPCSIVTEIFWRPIRNPVGNGRAFERVHDEGVVEFQVVRCQCERTGNST
jgi:hypothetical protein